MLSTTDFNFKVRRYTTAVTNGCNQTNNYLSNGNDAHAIVWTANPADGVDAADLKILDIIGRAVYANPGLIALDFSA